MNPAVIRRIAWEQSQTALVLVGLVAVWEIACDTMRVPRYLLPAPSLILAETWAIRGILPLHILTTAAEIIGGFILATLAGVPLAVAVVYSPMLRRIIYPLLLMLQSIPKVAIAPVLLLWVGYGLTSNIIVAATVAFFPIVINTATGLESVDHDLLDLTSSFGAHDFKVFMKVRMPWALPHLFSGLKVAITLAVIGAIVAEFISADKGLGYLILTTSGAMQTSVMFGVLVILSLLGTLCFYLVVVAERLMRPWYL